jgi:hypothetical protein
LAFRNDGEHIPALFRRLAQPRLRSARLLRVRFAIRWRLQRAKK